MSMQDPSQYKYKVIKRTVAVPALARLPNGFKATGYCTVQQKCKSTGAILDETKFIVISIQGYDAYLLQTERGWSPEIVNLMQQVPKFPKFTSSRISTTGSSRYVKYLTGYFGDEPWLSPMRKGTTGLKSILQNMPLPNTQVCNETMAFYNSIVTAFGNVPANGFEVKAYVGAASIAMHKDGGVGSQVDPNSSIGVLHFSIVPGVHKIITVKSKIGKLHSFSTITGSWILVGKDAQEIYHSMRLKNVKKDYQAELVHYSLVFRTQTTAKKFDIHPKAIEYLEREISSVNNHLKLNDNRILDAFKPKKQLGPQLYYLPNELTHSINKHVIYPEPSNTTGKFVFNQGSLFLNDRYGLFSLGFLGQFNATFSGPSGSGGVLSVVLSKAFKGIHLSSFSDDVLDPIIIIQGQHRNYMNPSPVHFINKWMYKSLLSQEHINFFINRKLLQASDVFGLLELQFFYLHRYKMARDNHWYYFFRKFPLDRFNLPCSAAPNIPCSCCAQFDTM